MDDNGAQAPALADEPATTGHLPEYRAFLRWFADSEAELKVAAEAVLYRACAKRLLSVDVSVSRRPGLPERIGALTVNLGKGGPRRRLQDPRYSQRTARRTLESSRSFSVSTRSTRITGRPGEAIDDRLCDVLADRRCRPCSVDDAAFVSGGGRWEALRHRVKRPVMVCGV